MNHTSRLIHNNWNKYDGTDNKVRDFLRFVAVDLARNKLKFTVYDFLPLDWTLLHMVRLTHINPYVSVLLIDVIITDNRHCILIHGHTDAISYCY